MDRIKTMEIKQMSKTRKYIYTGLVAGAIALLAGLLAGLLAVQRVSFRLENMAQDAMYQKAGVLPDDIKIITIDEATLAELGPYSNWNRSYFAELLEILNGEEENAPKVIGIDVLFSGTDDSESDAYLAEVCSRYDNIVLASTITWDSLRYKDEDGQYYRMQYVSGEGKPYEALAEVTEYGFTNAIYDDDGFVRRTYTQVNSSTGGLPVLYNSFAYRIATKAGEVKSYPSIVEVELTGKPGEFEHVSMADVLAGKIPSDHFKDCIVLIGAYEEGMMDFFRVPIDYSKEMYGVELQANYVHAFLYDKILYSMSGWGQFLVVFVYVACIGFWIMNTRMGKAAIGTPASMLGYVLLAAAINAITSYTINVLAAPLGIAFVFLAAVMYHYVELQKKRVSEMQGMLFSMAEAMAETIEGRTPYNANHTKNVAKRCVEMLDYINRKNKEKKTDLYFTEDDKRQLYLAAMLHDVGKMDIPLEVMDKPTKLGAREKELKDRLQIVSLHIEKDALTGVMPKEEAEGRLEKIEQFVNSLGAFNCGRPLKEEEWALVREIAESVYTDASGREIPYLSEAEIDDLYIKAGTLSQREREIMQSHVEYTDKILSHVQFGEHFGKVRAMAANHHELLNGKGYPKGIADAELDTMTRILTIMDIYDSLIADDRPYKKAKPVKVAFEILDEEAEAGKIDKDLLVFAKELYLKEESDEKREK